MRREARRPNGRYGAGMDADLLARVERLESLDEICQLVARYCLSLDMRDLDALVSLFPADVRVSKDLSGRSELRRWFDETPSNHFVNVFAILHSSARSKLISRLTRAL